MEACAAMEGMDLIREQFGLMAKVAYGLGLTRAAVTKWSEVPAQYLVEVEKITGIPRQKLRPDLYGPPPRRSRRGCSMAA
jgi:hypothetical protein